SGATRSLSAAAKSNSPFIARRVISATCARRPTKSASSSSISFSMIVDSRSATNTRLRRSSAGWTSTSIAALPIACPASASALAASPSLRTRSQARPGTSQSGSRLDKMVPIAAARPGNSASAPGPAINVRTRLIGTRRRLVYRAARLLRRCAPRNHNLFVRDCEQSKAISVRRDTKPQSPVVIVAGPTASGKSALALELAAARGGTIINADSQQIYRDLSILSARPDAASIRRVPHRLYGFLDAAERGSVALWRERALAEIAAAHQA